MKKLAMAAVAVLFLLTGGPAQAVAQPPAVYVALGDSLAAGQTPNRAIDAGYADFIAQELARHHSLAFFTKNLAYPGFTTEDVLERIKSEEAQEVLGQASLITLSAGANDLLRLVQADPAQGALAYEQISVDYALNEARKNMESILLELEKRAPEAEVYVMGYYFPYPHMRDSQKEGTVRQLERLNQILKQSAEKAGAVFVPVSGSFGENAVSKVPNASDVHPNFAGYQAMANAFFSVYKPSLHVASAELPPRAPMSFEQLMNTQNGGTAQLPSEQLQTDYLAITEPRSYI